MKEPLGFVIKVEALKRGWEGRTYKLNHRRDDIHDLILRILAREDGVVDLRADGVVAQLQELDVSMIRVEALQPFVYY